jgi:hypothetical protein
MPETARNENSKDERAHTGPHLELTPPLPFQKVITNSNAGGGGCLAESSSLIDQSQPGVGTTPPLESDNPADDTSAPLPMQDLKNTITSAHTL